MSQAQDKRQAQAECIIAQFAPLTDNPHDTRHEAIRQHQRNTYRHSRCQTTRAKHHRRPQSRPAMPEKQSSRLHQ